MNIRETYQKLLEEKLSKNLIERYNDLKRQCLREQNQEYFHLCNIEIIDIYFEYNMLDEALSLITKEIDNFDKVIYKNIYYSFLERIIYIYIKKGNFKLAYKYIFEKRNYINENNHDDINRWYLEMAYVYAEINQTSKALSSLEAILENVPSVEMQSIALSNITKIYIDQGDLLNAKKSLNECIKVTLDDEGMIYCNYLMAKICVLEKNYDEAEKLYDDMFDNNISSDYLGIVNEYLDLLISNEKLGKALDVIDNFNEMILNNGSLEIKRDYYKNKFKLLATRMNIYEATSLLKLIEEYEEKIKLENENNNIEALEDEKIEEVNNNFKSLASKLDRIGLCFSKVNLEKSIRSSLMTFSQNINDVIEFDEVSYVIFDKMYDLPFLNNDNTDIYQYKNKRIYERKLNFDTIDNTIIQMAMLSNKDISLDLTNLKLDLNDFITNRKYEDTKYLYCAVSLYDDHLYMMSIFSSKRSNLCLPENILLINQSIRLLENKMLVNFSEENKRIARLTSINTDKYGKSYWLYHFNNNCYLSNELMNFLGEKNNNITFNDYCKKIIKNDYNSYHDLNFYLDNINISYRIELKKKLIKISEYIVPIKIDEETTFSYSLIVIDPILEVNEEFNTLEYEKKIQELKNKTNDLQFKFSFIRLNCTKKDYKKIQEVFGVKPYFVDENTFVVILENEVNQRTLDSYLKNINCKASIVRYPRDLINIDDIAKFSKIGLEQNITYFTDEMYQKYLKKVSKESLIKKALNEDLSIYFLKVNNYNYRDIYEIRLEVKGMFTNENPRDFLDIDDLYEYDYRVYKKFIDLKINKTNKNFILPISLNAIRRLLDENIIENNFNIIYCLDYNEKDLNNIDLNKLLEDLKLYHLDIIIDHKYLEKINTFVFVQSYIKGLFVQEGISIDRRNNLYKIGNKFDLEIFSNYLYTDYEKSIYRTNEIIGEKEV